MIVQTNSLLEGFLVAKRNNRYRQLDYIMTRVLVVDAAVFILYLLSAALGIGLIKWLTAIVAIVGSALCLGFLYMTQEWLKRRSLWMTAGFAAIALCTLVSLICKVPFGPVA